MNESQTELALVKPPPKNADWLFLVKILEGKDWLTAAEVLLAMGLPATDQNKRSVRALAEQSEGRIAGGQKGYKLVVAMTKEEFDHYQNWMIRQAETMKRRVIASQRVFYSRPKVETGVI
jgi:hypothetical protein